MRRRKSLPDALVVLAGLLAAVGLSMGFILAATAGEAPNPGLKPPAAEKPVREIYVPFEDLNVLLEGQPRRFLLSRQEYDDLLRRAKTTPEDQTPESVVLVSADYRTTVERQRATITGTFELEVLEDGLHAVPLEVTGVALRRATLDGDSAAMGKAEDGRLALFVEGKGRHRLVLEMVAPVETAAARQVLDFRLPHAPSGIMRLTVPGDVEVQSGLDVVSRTVVSRAEDQNVRETRFELLPRAGDVSLVMSLNSHLQQGRRAVIARSVLVDEVTAAYERLHATVTLDVLHQPVDHFRFRVPAAFDVTDVDSPQLARWAMVEEESGRTLDVYLQEPTDETVVLNLSAVRASPPTEAWAFPRLEPLDVAGGVEIVGEVAVVGLLVEDRLKIEGVATVGLIPVDTADLTRVLQESVLHAEPGSPSVRPVVAYYAPQSAFRLSGRLDHPPAAVTVVTSLRLALSRREYEAQGVFSLMTEVEPLFEFDFSAPPGWLVMQVTGDDGRKLAFERYEATDEAARIRVRLGRGVEPGGQAEVRFRAVHAPSGELSDGQSTTVECPVFSVSGAKRDVGAILVVPGDDMIVRPEQLNRLAPLNKDEMAEYGLTGQTAGLALRYESLPYSATLDLCRAEPRLTARGFSFFEVEPDVLAAHCEVVFDVTEARPSQLVFDLPADETRSALSVEGLGGVKLKEHSDQTSDGRQRCTVVLEEGSVRLGADRRGTIRLAVQFKQPLPDRETKDYPLPIPRADGVVYQSGFVAVEGNAELDVQVVPDLRCRRVDVGEFARCEHQPGQRLLAAYGFSGEPPRVAVSIFRHDAYPLAATIAEQAQLTTQLSADGVSQTSALFVLHTKAQFLEVELPPDSELWSAVLDDTLVKPQRQGDSLLVSLHTTADTARRELEIVYQTPVASVELSGQVDLPAPRLLLRAGRNAKPIEVPVADLVWKVIPPAGYEVVRSGGTLSAEDLAPPELAAVALGRKILRWGRHDLRGLLGMTYHESRSGGRTDWSKTGSGRSKTGAREYPGKNEDRTVAAPRASKFFDRSESMPDTDKSPDFFGEGGAEEGEEMVPTEEPLSVETPRQPSTTPAEPRDMAERIEEQKRTVDSLFEVEKSHIPVPGEPPIVYPDAEIWKELERTRIVRQQRKGVRSLPIPLKKTADGSTRAVVFRSLGEEPLLSVTLAHRPRFDALGHGLGLVVILLGLALWRRSARLKSFYIVTVALVASVVPALVGCVSATHVCNTMFLAAAWLVPFYLAVALVRLLLGLLCRGLTRCGLVTGATVAMLLFAALPMITSAAPPAGDNTGGNRYTVQVIEPAPPVKIPHDAIVLPYDPMSADGTSQADRLLIPYDKYVELWNRANPLERLETPSAPAPYLLAGASYTTTPPAEGENEEYLSVEGRLEIDVLAEGFVSVPLRLEGGVLASAELDGKPARLNVVSVPAPNQAPNAPASSNAQEADVSDGSLAVLYISGKGRHELKLTVRMHLHRQGGWRVADGRLPAAPATAMSITIPRAQTDVRLGEVADRRGYETEQPGETIETSLGAKGRFDLQWRPKVAHGVVDQTLTVASTAELDVQEDGLRLVWNLKLEFRRGQRDFFRVEVPEGYLVEDVRGTNVRGWQPRTDAGRPGVEITLLETARENENFTVLLRRRGPVGEGDLREFDVPSVTVGDAAFHTGRLTVLRSPLLDLHVVSTSGAVRRADLSADQAKQGGGTLEHPLGIRPFQAYEFSATPFGVRLAAAPVVADVTATLQTIVKIADYEQSLDTRIVLAAQRRPIYRIEVFVPKELEIEHVGAPGTFQWAVTQEDGRSLLSVYLTGGRSGSVELFLRGVLGRRETVDRFALPSLEIRSVRTQEGETAVLVDPAYNVDVADLAGCQTMELEKVFAWITPQQRDAVRVALRHGDAGYQGAVELTARQASVSCSTFTNVKATERSLEETISLDFLIAGAGIREVVFLLPARMKDCRVRTGNLFHQKEIEPVQRDPSLLRLRITLQEEVMGELGVVVENDGPLSPGEDREVPIPVVETGDVLRRFVTLEQAGRDEIVVRDEMTSGLEAIRRQTRDWRSLVERLSLLASNDRGEAGPARSTIRHAYLVVGDARQPRLVFATTRREAVETVGASIGLAETVLVFDATGAYRAQQLYKLDNTTEPFLEILLPEGAVLWTARVAGQPVKPTLKPKSPDARHIRIPLVKTAVGDLAYDVILKYGGKVPPLSRFDNKVDFPLMHTENIHVELSQVRLHVPENYRWYDFGGTMRQATDEGDMAAGRVAFHNKQVKQLAETMRHGKKFEQARAEYNYKNIRKETLQLQEFGNDYADNAGLQEQLVANSEVLREADEELDRLGDAETQVSAGDNRDLLNQRLQWQKTTRSRSVVQTLGPNWADSAADQSRGPVSQGTSLNAEWLSKNKLDNPALVAQPPVGSVRPGQQTPGQLQPQGEAEGWPQAAGQQGGEPPKQPAYQQQGRQQAEELLRRGKGKPQRGQPARKTSQFSAAFSPDGKTVVAGGDGQVKVWSMDGVDSDEATIEEVTQALRKRIPPGGTEENDLLGTVGSYTGSGMAGRGKSSSGRARRGDRFRTASGEELAYGKRSNEDGDSGVPATVAAGMASLDIELPRRGRVLYFTKPRGDASITAQAVSETTVSDASNTGVAVAIVLIAAILAHFAARFRFRWLASRRGVALLLILGTVGLVFHLFVPLAAIALIGGLVLLVLALVAKLRTVESPTPVDA